LQQAETEIGERKVSNLQTAGTSSNGASYTILESSNPTGYRCIDENGLISGAVIFLVIQVRKVVSFDSFYNQTVSLHVASI
jgi:hypothetical protein